jgi:hypothetical protein
VCAQTEGRIFSQPFSSWQREKKPVLFPSLTFSLFLSVAAR